MSTTSNQDRDFTSALDLNALLERAIEWIDDNMDPEDVFSLKKLEAWAEERGYKQVEE